MRRALVLAALVFVAAGAGGAESAPPPACRPDSLAFQPLEPPPPQQSASTGIAVYNTGPACRLALPVALTLARNGGAPVRVAGAGRLTLTAKRLRTGGRASAAWAYTNDCASRHEAGATVLSIYRLAHAELRLHGGDPPCNAPGHPVDLVLLSACPSATGPAVDAMHGRLTPCR
jgi:hypothetical protein